MALGKPPHHLRHRGEHLPITWILQPPKRLRGTEGLDAHASSLVGATVSGGLGVCNTT